MDRGEERRGPGLSPAPSSARGQGGEADRPGGREVTSGSPASWNPRGDVKKTEEVTEARQLLQGAQDRGTGSGD